MNENTRLTRRDFLRAGALADTGTALGGLAALGTDLRPAAARAQSLRIRSAAVTPRVFPY